MENLKNKILIGAFILLGFISLIYTIYLVKNLLEKENSQNTDTPVIYSVTPTPNLIPTQTGTNFEPNTFYFEDTIVAITKSEPYIAIAATVTRNGKDSEYKQVTRVSYFNSKWIRVADYNSNSDSKMYTNKILKKWDQNIDDSRVLKEIINATLQLNNDTVDINTGELLNEISMRSLPGYTKFMSKGEGTITVNNKVIPTYILYTKIYSLNSNEIQFYSTPLGLETNWLIFFDEKGNTYHVDKTHVEDSTELYKTHQIAVHENQIGSVTKTFNLDVEKDLSNPSKQYIFNLNNPINKQIKVNVLETINKDPGGLSNWYMSTVEGTVTDINGDTTKGIGLVEYIKD